jgi:hypothetical protein
LEQLLNQLTEIPKKEEADTAKDPMLGLVVDDSNVDDVSRLEVRVPGSNELVSLLEAATMELENEDETGQPLASTVMVIVTDASVI